ncbi:SAM-dependent methyltransferase [Actinoplanes sp. NPDC026619]|uniref:SAM-dependent methyltransferase n=1 Tax=Actinoplanes sp. NPDC026619 TaxID=3155798 RepID=UPI003404472C
MRPKLSTMDAKIDTTQAHPARRYNYWLGGSHYFEADRVSGDAIEAAMPTIRLMAVENRRFLGRAAEFVAAQGVRQFLDIGTGLPAPGGVGDVVRAVASSATIVFVDNDPLVTAQAAALPGSYFEADIRSPREILDHPALAVLDLAEPVGLMLAAVLHFVRDDEDPAGIVRTFLDALAPGSYVVASHATWEYVSPAAIGQLQAQNPGGRFAPRDGDVFAAWFDGHSPVPPGLVSVAHWHAEGEPQPRPAVEDVGCNGLVARV